MASGFYEYDGGSVEYGHDGELMKRTRIKICGMTRIEDVEAAVKLGVDALGFVFYPSSPRYVNAPQAAKLIAQIPPLITTVGLFVNADIDFLDSVVEQVPLTCLQLHGDETPEMCALVKKRYGLPVIRAVRIKAGIDLSLSAQQFIQHAGCAALLLDAWSQSYGGAGKTFDWNLIPTAWYENKAIPVILSGGLDVDNITEAIAKLRPYAVDISSGVEKLNTDGVSIKGIKDVERMRAFIAAVRAADLI